MSSELWLWWICRQFVAFCDDASPFWVPVVIGLLFLALDVATHELVVSPAVGLERPGSL